MATRILEQQTRRPELLRQAGSALMLAIGVPLLAACSSPVPSASTGSTPVTNAQPQSQKPQGLQLPAYIPIELVKPDLAGTAAGVDPAYLSFPKNLVKSVKDTPSKGGDVSVFTRVILAAPPPLEQN